MQASGEFSDGDEGDGMVVKIVAAIVGADAPAGAVSFYFAAASSMVAATLLLIWQKSCKASPVDSVPVL
jgi:hypothetical protein